MVTRKLCVEVLDLVLTSFQTSFFSAPTVSKVQITDMLLLSTSFFSYPLPRSHRQGGFEKKMFPSTSYSFLFQIKAAGCDSKNLKLIATSPREMDNFSHETYRVEGVPNFQESKRKITHLQRTCRKTSFSGSIIH